MTGFDLFRGGGGVGRWASGSFFLCFLFFFSWVVFLLSIPHVRTEVDYDLLNFRYIIDIICVGPALWSGVGLAVFDRWKP